MAKMGGKSGLCLMRVTPEAGLWEVMHRQLDVYITYGRPGMSNSEGNVQIANASVLQ